MKIKDSLSLFFSGGFFPEGEIPLPPAFGTSQRHLYYRINAINLIDGIDGLAAGVALLILSTLGAWFYLAVPILLYYLFHSEWLFAGSFTF